MKKTSTLKRVCILLCLVLTAALALTMSGCTNPEPPHTDGVTTTTTTVANAATVLGEGETVFDFTVMDADGKTAAFEIHTDKQTVGEALLEVGLIAGEESQYGLYVKTVNGVTLDYEKDGKYWAFYENGNYALAGVDSTTIAADTGYMFKAE